jgi:DNA polymerase-3 subunit gamma/tau
VASLMAAGALVIAGAWWMTSRRPGSVEPVKAVAAPAPAPAPAPAAATAPAPEPAAPPPPRPQPQEAARIAPPTAPPPVPASAPQPAFAPPRAKQAHRRNSRQPASEQKADAANRPADGVPIMP